MCTCALIVEVLISISSDSLNDMQPNIRNNFGNLLVFLNNFSFWKTLNLKQSISMLIKETFFFFSFLSFFWGGGGGYINYININFTLKIIKSYKFKYFVKFNIYLINSFIFIIILKLKRSFFQAAVVSILLYGCTTCTPTKRLEKKLDDNYIRMLRAILNKSWRQHPTKYQLYGHLPPIKKTIQVRRTRHAGHCWRSRDKLISDVLLWTPTYVQTKAGRPARTYIHTYISYVRIRDVALKTCRRR